MRGLAGAVITAFGSTENAVAALKPALSIT